MLPKKDLGKLIKKAREYKSKKINKLFTQKMLADEIGKSRSYICDIERGRTCPSFATLSSIGKTCGVPLDFFQNYDDIGDALNKFIKLQLTGLSESEIANIREALKEDDDVKIDYIYGYINSYNLNLAKDQKGIDNAKNPEHIIKYILQSKTILDFYEIKKENSKEFSDEALHLIELTSYKYRK
ncbi:XRE family transcriptional regulator [Clostridium botulinum]|nr:XRE family transcriptional regulator [Clostridium botulinum]NFA19063.1 XRE family transcriptional regulator [Clostridium botulinum]NFA57846.1 XRE family transcriptional regulator [Clostridium botulinum]NFA70292.1 XRE family transcriptional regulator [Clostridium botulinum]NFA78168.1 XRE family transcriptional regulator [Clostridium botulinum]